MVLAEAANRIKSCLRSNDVIGRYGGDEFVVMLERIDREKSLFVAKRIFEEIKKPYIVEDYKIDFLSCSIGIAIAPDDGTVFHELLEKADQAMYNAKKGKNTKGIMFFQDIENLIERKISEELLSVLEYDKDEIYLKLQPLFDRNKNLIGVEVLARWLNIYFDDVPPNVFIPLVTRLGLQEKFDIHILKKVFKELERLKIDKNDIYVFVNLFSESFLSDDVFTILKGMFSDRLKNKFVIEITEETMLGSLAKTRKMISKYGKNGIKIAIDDFGKGYSSFTYLKDLDFDFLKIDMEFISAVDKSEKDKNITKSIAGLSRALGSKCIAEGVERETQFSVLKSLDIDYFQGFYFSKPILPEGFLNKFLVKLP